jgi:hypothetical protein
VNPHVLLIPFGRLAPLFPMHHNQAGHQPPRTQPPETLYIPYLERDARKRTNPLRIAPSRITPSRSPKARGQKAGPLVPGKAPRGGDATRIRGLMSSGGGFFFSHQTRMCLLTAVCLAVPALLLVCESQSVVFCATEGFFALRENVMVRGNTQFESLGEAWVHLLGT